MGIIIKKPRREASIFKAPIKTNPNPKPLNPDPLPKTAAREIPVSNYNPVGYIRELDLSRLNSSGSSEDQIQHTQESNDEFKRLASLKSDRKLPLDERYFRMKTTATNILLQTLDSERSLNNQNLSYFNRHSHLYLDYFDRLQNKSTASSKGKPDGTSPTKEEPERTVNPEGHNRLMWKFHQIKNLTALRIDKGYHLKMPEKEGSGLLKGGGGQSSLPVLKALDKSKLLEITKAKMKAGQAGPDGKKPNAKNFRIVPKKKGKQITNIKVLVEH